MKQNIRILFAEDKEIFRKAIIRELESHGISCIGEAGNGKELLKLLKIKKPDVVLLDLRMPEMNGNETMQLISELYPELKVIILSSYDEQLLVENYIYRGAKAFLTKDEISGDIDLLAGVIKHVHADKQLSAKEDFNDDSYTKRQKEIIPLICSGMKNREISQEIGIMERAVEKQRHKIYEKTKSANATEFFKYAFERGLQFMSNRRKSS